MSNSSMQVGTSLQARGNTPRDGSFSEQPGIRHLLPPGEWRQLAASVQRRFSHLFTPGRTVCYSGHVVENRHSRAGWWLAQLGRCFGSPLPLVSEPGPAAVTVTDHAGNAGGHWCRIYHRPRGAAQCIQSVKQFRGPTGLEESLGQFFFGLRLAIALRVRVAAVTAPLLQPMGEQDPWTKCLRFISDGLALYIVGIRLPLPRWLVPVELLVEHRPLDDQRFEFVLTLSNRSLGELIYQRMVFAEMTTDGSHEVGEMR